MSQIDPLPILLEIFVNKSQEVIENVIRIVEDNVESNLSSDEKLEAMINLLSETGTADTPTRSAGNSPVGNLPVAAGFEETAFEDPITETLRRLMDMIPDADPSYLESHVPKLAYDDIKLEEFINEHMDKKDYPKMEDYIRRQNEKKEMNKYLSQFKLYQFLLEFPNPIEHFNNPDRKHAFTESKGDDSQQLFVLKCLYNEFIFLRESDIKKVFNMTKKDIVKTYNKLKKIAAAFRTPRKVATLPDISINNMLLLQEIAFIQHEREIRNMLKEKELNFLRAKQLGLLESCNCCYTDDLIPEDCFLCRKGCTFCRECIRNAAEIAYSEGKTEYLCLADCGSDFSLATLQMVLNPKTFTNLCHTIQMQEINNAGLPGLEHCPLCSDFVMIPAPDDQIFHCERCNKDSCRKCKHEAHIPLRCNEIEYDEDVKMRTFIEDKMTQALIRKCYKCGTNIVKDSGCNKITCSVCNAKMCYVCRKPVTDYSHFNSGCPLHTDDRELHFQNVMQGASSAKAELGVDRNPDLLKFDPTRDLQK